jgi:ribose 5-phosphate isomerase A
MSDDFKAEAARAALSEVQAGMRLGLGTGSTARHFVDLVGAEVQRGLRVICVPTSEATAAQARGLGIPLTTLDDTPELDLTVDGADEIGPGLALIKGAGGALWREKIVAAASKRMVVIADSSKKVDVLGHFPLPIEVVPMARSLVAREVVALTGAQPVWREGVVTDNGNWILDIHGLRITDPEAIEQRVNQIPGVVSVGLFARRAADVVIVGGETTTVL